MDKLDRDLVTTGEQTTSGESMLINIKHSSGSVSYYDGGSPIELQFIVNRLGSHYTKFKFSDDNLKIKHLIVSIPNDNVTIIENKVTGEKDTIFDPDIIIIIAGPQNNGWFIFDPIYEDNKYKKSLTIDVAFNPSEVRIVDQDIFLILDVNFDD